MNGDRERGWRGNSSSRIRRHEDECEEDRNHVQMTMRPLKADEEIAGQGRKKCFILAFAVVPQPLRAARASASAADC